MTQHYHLHIPTREGGNDSRPLDTCPYCRRGGITGDCDGPRGSLHGLDACGEALATHDASCCERCARVGQCPVHGFTTDPSCDYNEPQQ